MHLVTNCICLESVLTCYYIVLIVLLCNLQSFSSLLFSGFLGAQLRLAHFVHRRCPICSRGPLRADRGQTRTEDAQGQVHHGTGRREVRMSSVHCAQNEQNILTQSCW